VEFFPPLFYITKRRAITPLRFLIQNILIRNFKNVFQRPKLNICDKTEPGLYTLYGVFIHAKSAKLKPVGERALRELSLLAKYGNFLSTDVIFSVFSLIYKHIITKKIDIHCLSFLLLYVILVEPMTFTECQN